MFHPDYPAPIAGKPENRSCLLTSTEPERYADRKLRLRSARGYMSTGQTAPKQALSGLRVIDAATLGAAPLAAAMLAEFGADVIKVEHPKRGDPLRDWGAKRNGVGLLWKSIGRNKRSITLDLHFEEGRELLRDLVKQADVLIVNFRPGRLERWKLDWTELRLINPKLIMLQITGFGYTGPYASRPGFGTLGEAMSGFAHTTGATDGPPTLPPFMLADGVASLNAVNAPLMRTWGEAQ